MDLVASQTKPKIIIVGDQPVAQVDKFRLYAQDQGCRVQQHPNGFSTPSTLIDPLQGIVIFDENGSELPERIRQVRKFTRYRNVPVIAVSFLNPDQILAPLLDAGASGFCSIYTPASMIYKEVIRRREPQPDEDHFRQTLFEPLTDILAEKISQLSELKISIRETYRRRSAVLRSDFSMVTTLFAADGTGIRGTLTLSFPELTAVGMACRMMAARGAQKLNAETVKSCLQEIADAASKITCETLRTHCALAAADPLVISGDNHETQQAAYAQILLAAYGCEFGEFALQLALKE